MQALKLGLFAAGSVLSVGEGLSDALVSPLPPVESSRWPQPASANAAMLKAAAARAVLLTRPPGVSCWSSSGYRAHPKRRAPRTPRGVALLGEPLPLW